ncbi:hypothetical protein CsatA_011843 [Cannabis sativa]
MLGKGRDYHFDNCQHVFFDWCIATFQAVNDEKCCIIATLCWAIWSARNKKVWQNKSTNALFLYALAGSYLAQWKVAQSSDQEEFWTGLLPGEGGERWCVPNVNEVNVNVDASIFRGNQGFGFGLVARNEHGFMLEGTIRLCNEVVRPELAEVIGVREALSWIKQNRW